MGVTAGERLAHKVGTEARNPWEGFKAWRAVAAGAWWGSEHRKRNT